MQTAASRPRGTIAQVVLAIIAIVVFGLAAVFFLVNGLSKWGGATPSLADQVPAFCLALVSALCCALMVPSLVYTRRNRSALPPKPAPTLLLPFLGLLVWVGVIFAGEAMLKIPSLYLLYPLVLILATGLPLWFLYRFTSRGLSAGSPQRFWGIFDFSLTVTPFTIIILEFLLLIVIVVVVMVAVLVQAGSVDQIQALSQQLQSLQSNPAGADTLFAQFGQQPGVLAGILLLVALIIPIIEEVLKPFALIVLAGRKPTPSQGFVAGLLCGAAFAFLETGGSLAGAFAPGWAVLALTRGGTSILHITCSALVGWGFASAFSQHNRKRFWGAYFSAVALHGTWNAFAILMGIVPIFAPNLKPNFAVASWLGTLAPIVLVVLAAGNLVILLALNRHLRRDQSIPPAVPMPPPLAMLPPLT